MVHAILFKNTSSGILPSRPEKAIKLSADPERLTVFEMSRARVAMGWFLLFAGDSL
jgi:hypothetical protein